MNATAQNSDIEINKRQLINGNINNDSIRNTDLEQITEVIKIPTNNVHEDIQIIPTNKPSQQNTKLTQYIKTNHSSSLASSKIIQEVIVHSSLSKMTRYPTVALSCLCPVQKAVDSLLTFKNTK